jgi:guanosine-3',5'-bis(diphosphate) 3'-pyrophosphohydrolase
LEAIARAHELAVRAHAGQSKASGEEYVSHAIEVAAILEELRLDTATIVAGLVHDTIEVTAICLRGLEREFGAELASIIDGVNKLRCHRPFSAQA